MRSTTRIYRSDVGLSCNIPTTALPTLITELKMETYIEPGYRYTSPEWFYVTVYQFADRTALILSHSPTVYSPAEMILAYGLDPTQRLQIRPYGTNIWIDAHIYHTIRLLDEQGLYAPERGIIKEVYGRVWLPKRPKDYWATRHEMIRGYTTYPVRIRGTTLPIPRTRRVWKTIKKVVILYLDRTYEATEYKEGIYRWDIPPNINCYKVIERAIDMGYQPMADFYTYGDLIYLNFAFPNFELEILKETGRAYRSTSDLKISLIDKEKYTFSFDIRSHYISICKQTYYVDPNGTPILVTQALAWTNKNLLDGHPGFANIRAGFKTGTQLKRKRWDKRLKRMITTVIDRDTPTLETFGMITKEKPRDYIGFENEEISLGELEREDGEFYKLYYAEKEVEYNSRGVIDKYFNERVESTMIGAKKIWIDQNGMVWWRKKI